MYDLRLYQASTAYPIDSSRYTAETRDLWREHERGKIHGQRDFAGGARITYSTVARLRYLSDARRRGYRWNRPAERAIESAKQEARSTRQLNTSGPGGSPIEPPRPPDAAHRRTDRVPRALLVTVGILVFILFASPEVDDVELRGVKLADWAEPRLVLAMAMLFSLVSLFQTLYRNLALERVMGGRVLFEIDPLSSELLRHTKTNAVSADVMELGAIARTLRWTTDLLVLLLYSLFAIALVVAVAFQLREVFAPVISAARAGNREMQAITVLGIGLLLAATLRAVSCLVVGLAPRRRNLREELSRLKYPIRWLRYFHERRKYQLFAEQSLERARAVLLNPDAKSKFDQAFHKNIDNIQLFGRKDDPLG